MGYIVHVTLRPELSHRDQVADILSRANFEVLADMERKRIGPHPDLADMHVLKGRELSVPPPPASGQIEVVI
jgi:hypothetical protein